MRVQPRPKVFISHSTSADADAAALVDRLRERLSEWGADPWRDIDRLRAGQVWNDEIRLAIERCDAAILVITNRYLRSGAHYARDEALIFVQRAATEPFDDFRLLVLLAPDVESGRLATDPDWSNLEIARRQIKQLSALTPDQIDGLRADIDELVQRYCSGTVPLVLREYYAESLTRKEWSAVLAQAAAEFAPALGGTAATPRRYVNVLLGAVPTVGRTPDAVERSLQPWRGVLPAETSNDLAWDAVAFTWIDEATARKVGSVTRTVGTGERTLLVLTAAFEDTVRLHLRRAREYIRPFDETVANPARINREGVIRALCVEIKARRARRERRDPLTIGAEALEGLAADLNNQVGPVNPLVAILGRDLCSEDLLDGLPELFSNIILVAMADEDQAGRLGPKYVVLRPQREEEVLQWLGRLMERTWS